MNEELMKNLNAKVLETLETEVVEIVPNAELSRA